MNDRDVACQTIALRVLDRLEQRELELLTWGSVDGVFSEDEVYEEIERVLDAHAEGDHASGGFDDSDDLEADDVIEWLIDRSWLWEVPLRNRGFRTRFAESVRLMSRLRQIRDWDGDIKDDAWRTAPNLVADFRLAVRPRAFPRREYDLVSGIEQNADAQHRVSKSGLLAATLTALIADESGQARLLAGFQLRATTRILLAVDAVTRGKTKSTGTVVCAGTGSGKTLAFYLPALAEIATRVDETNWVKALAVYPRNELLKDQLREALISGRKAKNALDGVGKRPIAFASLTGLVPNNPDSIEYGYSAWRAASFDGEQSGPARICPFVRCLRCNGDLAWLDQDRKQQRERLVCLDRRCGDEIFGDELRLTRSSMLDKLPDVLFISTEMMNQRLSSTRYAPLLGLGRRREERPIFLLLDEIHDYEGTRGAHTAMLLRRWRYEARASVHYVGLSATLEDAERFFGDLVGVRPASVRLVQPEESEMKEMGAEYLIALRGDPSSGAGLLSTTIQTAMLARRILGNRDDDDIAGSRVFAFADDLDVINRLYFNLMDAEARDKRGAPTGRKPLAFHRGRARPMADARLREGQNWDLLEQIGHDLGSPLVIARTSSQDVGVDSASDVTVATTSLEVGFDDPTVGAVVQHKSPPGNARFLQRKGRAGRTRLMRPWTVVVLSDFGRDRVQYQSYEHLFSPVLAPRYLPLANRTMLRMQATYALFSWLGRRVHGGRVDLWPWTDLAAPIDETSSATARRDVYLKRLKSLLEDEDTQKEFRSYLSESLGVPVPEVDALLWEPPRAVLLGAVPTILRRLETNWQRAFRPGEEPQRKFGPPIPEFVQAQLFGELLTPEVEIQDVDGRDQDALADMRIVQALSEFSPGRVSRRFGIRSDWGHWIDPGDLSLLDIDEFCPPESRERVRVGRYREAGEWVDIPIYRPSALRVCSRPQDINPSSNSRQLWRAQVVPSAGEPHRIDPPSGTPWSELFLPLAFHTHHLGCPVEVRRFTLGSRVSIVRQREREPEFSLRFATKTESGSLEPAALGFAADVDGVHFRYRPPVDLARRCSANPELSKSLGPAFFRDSVRGDERLDGKLNPFQREQLADAFLTAALEVASRHDLSLERGVEAVVADPEHMDSVLVLTSLWSEDEAEGVDAERENGLGVDEGAAKLTGSRRLPKRVGELRSLLREPSVRDVLSDLMPRITRPAGTVWEDWLRERFRATLAAAARQAVLAMCPRTDPDSILVELHGGTDIDDEQAEFWIVETVLGGAGALEAFHDAYSRDPRRYFRLLEMELGPNDTEATADRLELTLAALESESDGPIAHCFDLVRRADSHEEARAANAQLRGVLAESAIVPAPSFFVALHARLLRPGTRRETDHFLAGLLQRWNDLQVHLACEVDEITMAVIASDDASLEETLGLDVPGGMDRRTWRYSVLRSLLWARGGRLRQQALLVENRFEETPACDRLIVNTVIGDYIRQISIDDTEWFGEMIGVLAESGACDLHARLDGQAALAEAVMHVATNRLETEGLRLHARLVGIRRSADGWFARLELPEAYQ